MKELDQNTISTIDRGKKRKKERRDEFQQFKTEETERIKEERGNVHKRKRHPIRLVEYVCSGQGRVEFAVDRWRRGGQWFTSTIYGRERALQQFKSERVSRGEEREFDCDSKLSQRLYAQRALEDLGYENKILEIKIPKYGIELGKILTLGFYILYV